MTRAGWRDAGLDGPHPKINPGRGPLAAMPPGVRGTLPRSGVEAVPGEGRYQGYFPIQLAHLLVIEQI